MTNMWKCKCLVKKYTISLEAVKRFTKLEDNKLSGALKIAEWTS